MNAPDPTRELAGKRLERDIGTLLRSLPDQAAPAGLEARVLARIEAEARVPWYRRGFSRWPGSARMLLLPVLLAATAVTMGLASRIGAALPSSGSLPAAERVGTTWAALRDAAGVFGHLFSQLVPSQWLYFAAGGAIAAYLMTLLLGAIAFRTLLPHSHRT